MCVAKETNDLKNNAQGDWFLF